MLTTFAVITAIFAVATLLPLWRHEHWLVRSMDFPRLQLFVLLGLLVVFEVLLLDLSRPASAALLAVALLCMVYQGWWIIPYTRLFPREVKSSQAADADRSIAIMTANVLTTNRNAAGLLALVRDHQPDIFVTLESDLWWQAQLDSLEGDYPYSIKCPLDNMYGMHVYSRLPLSDCHTEFLVEDDKPSMHALATLPSGCEIRLHFLHPAPPSPTENDSSSPRDAELIVVGKSVADAQIPVIVTGDLNDVAWSETTRLFRKISGLLDPRVGRGMFNSFHADYWFARWPLDHLFHSHHFTLAKMQRLASFGSDHFAIYAQLVFESVAEQASNGLEPDADDLQLSREKISQQDVAKADVPQPGGRAVHPLVR